MTSLQQSLDAQRAITNDQVSEARGNLTEAIASLTQSIQGLDQRLSDRLAENSKEVAALNATLSGVDRRLSESIARQQAFETAVLQRIVYQGPLTSGGVEKVSDLWKQAGYDVSPFAKISEGDALNQWWTNYIVSK